MVTRTGHVESVSYFERGLNNRFRIVCEWAEAHPDHEPYFICDVFQDLHEPVRLHTTAHRNTEYEAVNNAIKWILLSVPERHIVIHNGQVYDITSEIDDETGRWWAYVASQIADDVVYVAGPHTSKSDSFAESVDWVKSL